MKAAQISRYGGPEVIEVRQADQPKPTTGQVLVEVQASSINPFDVKVRKGLMQQMRPLALPITVGADVAGVIAAVGPGVDQFAVGDRVYGSAGVFGGGSGAMAEFAAAKADQLGHSPKSVDSEGAAAVVLVGLSAMEALVDTLGITAGQRILIHGGSGGIGSAAIQLAKYIGCQVITTVRSGSAVFAKKLGADEVIDFEAHDFTKQAGKVDAIFDPVGGDTFVQSFKVLKKGGMIASMAAGANEELDRQYGVHSVGLFTRTSTVLLDRLAKLVDAGAISPQVERTYPLEQAAEAFAAFERGGVKGKYVVEVA